MKQDFRDTIIIGMTILPRSSKRGPIEAPPAVEGWGGEKRLPRSSKRGPIEAAGAVMVNGSLPNHAGVRKAASFSANLDKGIFRCFGCGAQGNVIDFAALMENLDPKQPEHVRRAALILADRYRIESQRPKPLSKSQKPRSLFPASRL